MKKKEKKSVGKISSKKKVVKLVEPIVTKKQTIVEKKTRKVKAVILPMPLPVLHEEIEVVLEEIPKEEKASEEKPLIQTLKEQESQRLDKIVQDIKQAIKTVEEAPQDTGKKYLVDEPKYQDVPKKVSHHEKPVKSKFSLMLNKVYLTLMSIITYPYLKNLIRYFRYHHFNFYLAPKINKKDHSVLPELNSLKENDLTYFTTKMNHITYGNLLDMSFFKDDNTYVPYVEGKKKEIPNFKSKIINVGEVSPPPEDLIKKYNLTKEYIQSINIKSLLSDTASRNYWKNELKIVSDKTAVRLLSQMRKQQMK